MARYKRIRVKNIKTGKVKSIPLKYYTDHPSEIARSGYMPLSEFEVNDKDSKNIKEKILEENTTLENQNNNLKIWGKGMKAADAVKIIQECEDIDLLIESRKIEVDGSQSVRKTVLSALDNQLMKLQKED